MSIDQFNRAFVFDGVADTAALLDTFRKAYKFPDYVAQNWDSLADALISVSMAGTQTLIVLVDCGLDEESCDTLYDIVDQLNETIPQQRTQLLMIGGMEPDTESE